MRTLASLIALLTLAVTPASVEVKPDQWLYREVDGWPGPVASFLSDVLVVSYVGESELETDPDARDDPLAFVFA